MSGLVDKLNIANGPYDTKLSSTASWIIKGPDGELIGRTTTNTVDWNKKAQGQLFAESWEMLHIIEDVLNALSPMTVDQLGGYGSPANKLVDRAIGLRLRLLKAVE